MKKKTITEKKNKKQEMIKYVNEDTNEVKKFIYILVGVALVAILLYFVSAKYLIKDRFQNKDTDITESINYDDVNIGNVFNRPYDTYFILATDGENLDYPYLMALKQGYKGEEKIYNLDLSLDINKTHTGEVGNRNATNPSELILVNPTLIRINNGTIVGYYEGIEEIESILK